MARVRYFRRVRAAPHVAGITPPVNTVLPVITGDVAGEESSTSNGTWTGSSTFTYQWYLDGVLIEGETAATIETDEAWVGQTLTATVFAGNGAGVIGATSVGVVLTEGSAYTGPLDLVPGAVVAYGQRALSAAKLGTAIYTLRENSGNTTQSFNSDAVTGDAPVAAINTFLNGASGLVTTWVDQSANSKNVTQATSSKQPLWVESTTNSRPGFSFNNAAFQFLVSADITLASGAYSFIAVYKKTSDPTGRDYFWFVADENYSNYVGVELFDNDFGGEFFTIEAASGDFTVGAGATSDEVSGLFADYNVTDSAWTYGSIAIKNNGVVIAIDSVDDFGTAPVGSITNPLTIGVDYTGRTSPESRFFKGQLMELLIYDAELSAAQLTSLRTNLATYYGIALP